VGCKRLLRKMAIEAEAKLYSLSKRGKGKVLKRGQPRLRLRQGSIWF
jgi:hypothetical protein